MVKISRILDYSDLDLDFIAHPTTGDVMKKSGVEAIKRALRNLILTNFYDRPFRPYIGSNAQKLLFENASPLVENFLKDAIKEVIYNFEPRVAVQQVEVKFDIDNNGYVVRIFFIILNTNEPSVSTIFLERIR
jgi:phage baseplate assembly protein W